MYSLLATQLAEYEYIIEKEGWNLTPPSFL